MTLRSIGLVCFVALFSISDATAQTWTSLGPTGGTVEGIVVAPSQASTLLALPGNDAGGLFLSTNSGTTWTSIAPGLCDAHVSSVAFHPTQPSTIFVGTLSAGVCRTTDSGATWTTLASGLPTGTNNFPRAVRGIALNPSTPTTVVAGTEVGLYRSTDNGATWTLVGGSGIEIQRVAISPSTPATAYATSATGVLKSIDSGATWTAASTGLPSSFDDGSSLTIDPSNANVVYVAVDTVYKTSNGGTSWSASNSGLGAAFFISNVIIDPTNTNVLYVNAIGGTGLSKSTNGGASWTAQSNTGLPSFSGIPGVTQTLAIEPGSATNLLAGAPGAGAFRSTDAGATWSAINTNLAARQVYAPALQPGTGTTPAPLLISTRTETDSSEIHRLTGGVLPFSSVTSPFTANDSGNIEWMAVDPTNANTVYVLGGDVNGQHCSLPYKTTNGGTSWTLMNSGLAANHCGNHLAIDPATPNTLYLSMFLPSGGTTTGLYKSTNGGATWTASNTGLNTGGVNRIAISPLNSNLLYVSTGSQVFKSTNAGASWTNASAGLPTFSSGGGSSNLPQAHLAIDPGDDAIVYVGTHAGVYRTANGGTSWTARTSGWPTLNGTLHSVAALAIDPVTPTTLFASPGNSPNGPSSFSSSAARGVGLYRSMDSGATWTAVTGTIAGAIVTEVVFDAGRAIYATTNNGLFKFTAALPTIAIDKSSLAFSAVTDGTALLQKTSSQLVRITQSGTGTVSWTASSNVPWLVVSPASGNGSATLTVSVQFAAGLTSTQSGAITLTFTGASNTAGPVAVTLTTLTSTAAVAPFGAVDTPDDGITGVAGSIGVTGWSLDDVEVTRVRIFRSPVAGEAAGTLVFIGDAVFVDGARPDVQAQFPNMPRASRAGWGYLMLTNFLPGLGNGTFVLHAIAEDADGHSVTLGTKTITCSNSTSTAPFGAIDTPLQGETVTSASLNNFGWVLSPGSRKASPPDGGTVRVVINGSFGVSPGGWTSRSDLSALFPVADFSGIGNALGVATLDVTALANGVHTISWVVTDNLGSASGIGSRYFTVAVGNLFLDPSATSGARGRSAVIASNRMFALPPATLAKAAPEGGAIAGRRGFDPDAPLQRYVETNGRATMQSEELDRIELHLGGTEAERKADGTSYVGYLRVGDGLAPLPAGSALNGETGEFTWQPGVAFVGAYDFVFARVSGGEAVARRDVRVVLNPKGSGRVGPQTVIDISNGQVVAGWAADLDSQVDSGVDAIHVWAYPEDGSDPIFVGAADYGGSRPDVAAIFGQRFLTSGYGIRVRGLAPGTYDLAVFAYSTVQRRFVPAKTTRISVPSR